MSGIGGVVQGARLAAAAAGAAEALGNVGKGISTGAAVATGVAGATGGVTIYLRSGHGIQEQLRAVVEGQKGRTSTPPAIAIHMRGDSVVGKHNRIGGETIDNPIGTLDHIEGQKGGPALATGGVEHEPHGPANPVGGVKDIRIALDHEKIGDSNVLDKGNNLSGGGLLNYDTCHIGDPGCLSAGLISDFTGLGVVDHEPHGQEGISLKIKD